MASTDPIADFTPNKRRKVDNGKGWDSQDDSGDELTTEDFATVPTQPLRYTKDQFHSDMATMTMRPSSPPRTFKTQPTQPLLPIKAPDAASQVLIDRSSPILPSSSPKRPPEPIKKAPFAKPRGFLASAMAPPGTAFRQPLGVQSKPKSQIISGSSDDEDEDPPVRHSSDEEETQGLRSNLKPTNFKKGGRGLDSTPNRDDRVRESPRGGPTLFNEFLKEFGYNNSSSSPASKSRAGDDMAAAYGGVTRRPRPQQIRQMASLMTSATNAVAYNKVDDIGDWVLRKKVHEIKEVLVHESVQRCMDALSKSKGNVSDAIEWLSQDEERDAPAEDDSVDELTSAPSGLRRGLAVPSTSSQEAYVLQNNRPTAKQAIKAPTQTIAEKYGSNQAGRRPSAKAADEVLEPRRRLQQGRKMARAPSPPSSPPLKRPQPLQRAKRKVIEEEEEEEEEEEAELHPNPESDHEEVEIVAEQSSHDTRLLKFFNECSIQDMTDISAQPEKDVELVLSKRPFETLDMIRTISNAPETQAGRRKSRVRPVGDKMVDTCSDMWTGYDAVDELVEECERMAKPIQEALKGWGVGASPAKDGELHLMNLDEAAHDSAIGTPASSTDDTPVSTTPAKAKNRFLAQPESMNSNTTLKDYQLVGLNWMNLLWTKKISCILADDMGLGKTCQVIAFLAHLREQNVDGVHLIIVPGSTLENWLREFAHFAPGLKVVPYYGLQKERLELQYQIENEIETIDVIVTTYGMTTAADDNKFLRARVKPTVCVFDEAHQLRNVETAKYNQLMRIPAAFRVLLTGTPLQNNLKELIGILAFLMPQMFNDKYEALQYVFKYKATTKDVNNAALLSAQRINRARSMVAPFILRRKKHQVLDLPTKHSRVVYCDMTETQANYYRDVLDEAQQLFTSGKTGQSTSNVLVELRKAANHPLLSRLIYNDKKIEKIVKELLKHEEFAENGFDTTRQYLVGEHAQSFGGGDYGLHAFCANRPYLHKFALKKREWMDAGKIQEFRKLITGFVKNGDRVLVFSQWTKMMDVLEAVLDTLDIKFFRLDGGTKIQDRQAMIDDFTNGHIPVFMLSTIAGGAGINLACANKVIIFDSGFNPQDDVQAENRAHRVGQTKEVEVIRLVSKQTIEEQIHALGESKLALDERVAGDPATEAAGEAAVKKMLAGNLEERQGEDNVSGNADVTAAATGKMDLRDAFKTGMEDAGVSIRSRQQKY